MRRWALVGFAGIALLGWSVVVPAALPGPGAQSPQAPSQPVFRAGASFVRVDAYATREGRPVTDLTADDFEIFEDGAPQTIQTFEQVRIDAGAAPASRVEPGSLQEARAVAGDPRARVFVVFLDTWHIGAVSGARIIPPLVNLFTRLIGPDDLVAVMTPQMSVQDITFTRRTDELADRLSRGVPLDLGHRDRAIKDDPVEQLYEYCYPPQAGDTLSWIARDMILRRREMQSLDALADLVVHLGGLREERKAILLVSEGWLLYQADRKLAAAGVQQLPGLGVGPTGRLDTSDRNNPHAGRSARCDRDRILLGQLDNVPRFRNLLSDANHANATFYPVDPAGLRVFDSDIGPERPPTLEVDRARLRQRLDTLVMSAINTDGVPVIDANDLQRRLDRVVADLTTYYLIGYTSTNGRLDGSLRSIRVRSRRPGVAIRARSGYRAPSASDVRGGAADAAPPVVDEARAAVDAAIASLSGRAADDPLQVQVSLGWWTPAGSSVAQPGVWMAGRVDPRHPDAGDWSRGGTAELTMETGEGNVALRETVDVPAQTGRFGLRFPQATGEARLTPGPWTVRIRLTAEAGGLPLQDTRRVRVPPAPAGDTLVLGEPLYSRKGPSTGNTSVPAADRRYRRTERVAVRWTVAPRPDTHHAELLDRTGRVLPLAIASSAAEGEGAVWLSGELALAPLAPGDYVLRLTATLGAHTRHALAPFKVVP